MIIDRMENGKTEVRLLKPGDVFFTHCKYYLVVNESNGTTAYFDLFDGTRLYITNTTPVIHCPIATIYPWGR